MKVVYLIQAHTEPNTLDRLLRILKHELVHVYVHIDAKCEIEPFLKRSGDLSYVTFIQNRIRVYWGGWSQVEATINLLKAAFLSGVEFDRFVLLSGFCYPVQSLDSFHSYIAAENFEFISARPMPDERTHKHLNRLNVWTFEGGYREHGFKPFLIRTINRILRAFPVRNISEGLRGLTPYAGSNWWVLSHRAVSYIIEFLDNNPQFVGFFKTTKMPDECFFHTILCNSSFKGLIRKNVTYADWSNPNERPCVIGKDHLEYLSSEKYIIRDEYGEGPVFFARKFTERNSFLLKEIEHVRN